MNSTEMTSPGLALLAPEARGAPGWQLVLADLALILFLVTLAVLAATGGEAGNAGKVAAAPAPPALQLAPSQALFRPSPDGPTLAQWLAEQPLDKRATLTVMARHQGDDRAALWDRADALAREAEAVGVRVRVVITNAPVSDLYASLAYDAPAADRR